MVQARDMVEMEFLRGLLNGTNANDLQWPSIYISTHESHDCPGAHTGPKHSRNRLRWQHAGCEHTHTHRYMQTNRETDNENDTDQYSMAVSAPRRSSVSCRREDTSNTRINVPYNHIKQSYQRPLKSHQTLVSTSSKITLTLHTQRCTITTSRVT